MAQQVARIEHGIVVERAEIPDGATIAGSFHPDFHFVLCSAEARAGWSYDGVGFFAPPPPQPLLPTAEMVNAERDRRIAGGFRHGGVAFQLDEASISRVTAMGADARFALLAGVQPGNLRWADPDNDFGWIASDNSIVAMDAQAMAALADAAKIWVSRHTFAARAIKDVAPIPTDYAGDSYWPVSDD